MIYEFHPPNQKPAPYTTRFGTTISSRILSELMKSIAAGTDSQTSITDHLRDPIPPHDEDLDEAMEVYNHAEGLLEEQAIEDLWSK